MPTDLKSKKSSQKKADLKAEDFVHLHLHSHYSLLDGLTKIPELVARIKELGMSAVALTDHGSMSGSIEFYQQCSKQEIKPIIGMEAYLARTSHLDKTKEASRFTHLILLAQNQQGYLNLMELASIAYLKGFYYKPRIDKDLLEKYNEGLIVLSGCLGGEISEALQTNNYNKAKQIALWYKQVFGDRFYLELQNHHNQPVQQTVNEQILKLADELKIEPVVTSDSHYLNKDDAEAHEVLLSIQTKSFIDDPKRMTLKGWNLSVADPQEIIDHWQDICPKAITNTKKIADSCKVDLEFDKILLPKYETPDGLDSIGYLEKLVFEGLATKYADLSPEQALKKTKAQISKILDKVVVERAEYELATIKRLDFADYFLIVYDFCQWGKANNIYFGPGRGSVAGSIVSYSLDISTIDPLKYDLLFERFLNPERISMPDIDIDIEDSRRDEVIEYVVEKYGRDQVAHIVTFGTMAARNAVRDVARVLKMSYLKADQLAKMLPPPVFGRNVSLKNSLKDNEDLQRQYNSDSEIKKIFDLALQLEGTIRSHGVHAAGVVISPTKMTNYCPLEINNKGIITTQYSMNPVEDLGLLKMDFLALSTLTIIKNALRIIRKVYGVEIDINKVKLDDKAVFELLARADTLGVFQLESGGMRQYLQALKPNDFEDVVAMLALYRPGPLSTGLVDDFVKRKNGQQKITVIHKDFEPILRNTYGVLVYQEQVMRISRDICGFTGAQADELRKGMGKKIPKIMKKLQQQFIDGGIKHGKIPKDIMEKLWQDVVGFADYAFNRSHSVAYGVIAYQTAYLKTHYRAAFMAAVMTSEVNNFNRLKSIIVECNQSSTPVLRPDINQSFPEFAVIQSEDKSNLSIRFGLEAIKNTSSKAIRRLVDIRDEGGPYKSLDDFILRQKDNPTLNRKTIESFTKSGVFDDLMPREKVLANLDRIIHALAGVNASNQPTNQASLLDLEDQSLSVNQFNFDQAPGLEVDLIEKLEWERDLLGIYISEHPLDVYQTSLDKLNLKSLDDLEGSQHAVNDGTVYKVGGLITNLKSATAKISRRKMAIIDFEDRATTKEFVVFPAIFEKYQNCWQEGRVLILTLKAQAVDSNGNTLLNPSWTIESAQSINRA